MDRKATDDPLADELRKEFKKAKTALTRAFDSAAGLKGVDDTNVRRLQALNGVLAFYGLGAAKTGWQRRRRDEAAARARRRSQEQSGGRLPQTR